MASNQGGWINNVTRLAIYQRDGMACVWCKRGIECKGVILSLDHIVCVSSVGSTNAASNLITCCKQCNEQRGTKSVKEFAFIIKRNDDNAKNLIRKIKYHLNKPLDRAAAKAAIASRA